MYFYYLEILRHDEDYYSPKYTLVHERKYTQQEFMDLVKRLANEIVEKHNAMTILENFSKLLLRELEKYGFKVLKKKWTAKVCESFTRALTDKDEPNVIFIDLENILPVPRRKPAPRWGKNYGYR